MKKTTLLIICLLLATSFFAQDKIETDRPDQTETPFTVPKGYFQGEFGFNKVNLGNHSYQLIHPAGLLKYGLSSRFELRLEPTYFTTYEQRIPNGELTSTLAPVEVGFKLALLEEKGICPKLSLITHVGIPFLASKHSRPDHAPILVRLAMQNSLSKNVALGYNVGFETNGSDGKTGWFYTFAPGFELGEKWYAYVEVFGTMIKDEPADHAVDGGLAYFISNNVKVDVSAGFGLSTYSFKNYIALGFSFRLPLKR